MTSTEVVVLPADRSACRLARGWANERLGSLGLDHEVHENVVLCVSELVANVLEHTTSAPVLSLTVGHDILVEVDDSNGALAAAQPPSAEQTRGWGLRIVDRVADSWGSRPKEAGGKVVWFRVARSSG